MRLHTKRIISFLLAVTSVFMICVTGFAGEKEVDGTDSAFTADDFLTTDGQNIVNQKGEKVQLNGVNLGAWMIWEGWLCPYEDDLDHYTVLEVLTERFGEEKAYELFNTYMDNWITEYDLDEIKSMGFNCVRVPFWFRNFYYDDNGRKILDASGEWDFSRLEWVVRNVLNAEFTLFLICTEQ